MSDEYAINKYFLPWSTTLVITHRTVMPSISTIQNIPKTLYYYLCYATQIYNFMFNNIILIPLFLSIYIYIYMHIYYTNKADDRLIGDLIDTVYLSR